jgi:PERQ amino acid-rich with GYF domain-containing protein
MRRRPSQSTDYLSSLNTTALERPRMMVGGSATGSSPLRERFGAMKRKDSGGGTAGTIHL